jgi:hypothetical protein
LKKIRALLKDPTSLALFCCQKATNGTGCRAAGSEKVPRRATIGGRGSDMLNAGKGNSIVIGGYTNLDTPTRPTSPRSIRS